MKKILPLLLALVLLSALAIPALAAGNSGPLLDFITDDAGVISEKDWQALMESAEAISEEYQCGVYIVTVSDHTDIADGEVMDAAEFIYEEYLLGYGDEKDGVLLLISVNEGLCGLFSQGLATQALAGQAQALLDVAVSGYSNGGYAGIMYAFLDRAALLISQIRQEQPVGTQTSDASSLKTDGFVTDQLGLLTVWEESELEERAETISQTHQRGVYIIITDDYTRYSDGDLYTTAGDIYLAKNLGLGAYRDGILLLLSLEQREVALISHDGSEQFITAEDKDWLVPLYLKHFREDDWYEGFDAYLSGCDALLRETEETVWTPEPSSPFPGLLTSLVLGLLTAWITVALMGAQMRSVFKATGAQAYASHGGLNLLHRSDRFVNRTVTRRKIETSNSNSSGGSRHADSRGFSGRTDRF